MSIKTFYIYALGRSCYALSENGIVIMLWHIVLEVLVFENEEFC